MPWHASNKGDDAEGVDNEDQESQQYRPISKKINYAALEAIIGSNADGNPKESNPSTTTASASTPSRSEEAGEDDDPVAAVSPRPRTATNPLLEKTVRATLSPTKNLSLSMSSPALLQNNPKEREEEELEEEEVEEEEDVDDEEEEVDWGEGNELW